MASAASPSLGARPFGAEWLRGEPGATSFLRCDFADARTRVGHVERAAKQGIAPAALEALRAEPSADRPAAKRPLDALGSGSAAVVVTGQQAGLLLGPLYTFHKALSALAIAQALEAETGIPCIPLFWVQDEDHDFDEVAVLRWLTSGGALVERRLERRAPRVSLGDREVPEDVPALLDDLYHDLEAAPAALELRHLIDPWRRQARWSSAFAECLARAFWGEPLLILRGRAPVMARAAQPFQETSILRAGAVSEALAERAAALEGAGYRAQVPVRERCLLGFFHPDGPSGPRFRPEALEGSPERLRLPERPETWGRGDLMARLSLDPLSFSTSALLRPIVQDGLLPVAAQVVGPGEAAYLAQLSPLRALFGVAEPMIVPRGQALWVEPDVKRRLEALATVPGEAIGDPLRFLARRAGGRPELSPEALRERLIEPVERALVELGPLDPMLEAARRRTLASVRTNLSRLIGRVTRSQASADAVLARRLAEVRAHLLPGGQPQERWLGLANLVARHGLERLKACFLDAYRPYRAEVLELYP